MGLKRKGPPQTAQLPHPNESQSNHLLPLLRKMRKMSRPRRGIVFWITFAQNKLRGVSNKMSGIPNCISISLGAPLFGRKKSQEKWSAIASPMMSPQHTSLSGWLQWISGFKKIRGAHIRSCRIGAAAVWRLPYGTTKPRNGSRLGHHFHFLNPFPAPSMFSVLIVCLNFLAPLQPAGGLHHGWREGRHDAGCAHTCIDSILALYFCLRCPNISLDG